MNSTFVIIVIALVVVGGITVMFLALISRNRGKGVAWRPKPPMLTEAESLFGQGQYQLSVIKAFAAIEYAIKTTAESRGMLNQANTSFDYLKNFQDLKILSPETVSRAHQVRMTRNRAIHEHQGVSKTEAQQLLGNTHSVLTALRFRVDQ